MTAEPVRANALDDIGHLAIEMQKKGFVKLENFFSRNLLEAYKRRIMDSAIYHEWVQHRRESEANQAMTTAVDATRVHYRNDSDLAEGLFAALSKDPVFQRTLTTLTGRSLVRTNNHVFEIVAGNYSGLDWHVGYYSFSYTRPEDYGCTLWIPLEPITPEHKGGMQYIPRDILDGAFLYRFAAWHFEMLKKMPPGKEYLQASTSDKYMVNALSGLVDSSAPKSQIWEHTFNIGDAFFFDKNVIHRSSPLLPGKLKTRMALICRFVEVDALYDRERFFNTFHHLHKSAVSMADDEQSAEESDEAADAESISPQDPFLFALARSRASHLTPLRSASPVAEELGTRLFAAGVH